MSANVINWITQNGTYLIAIAAGLFALIRYIDQRQLELRERRFEQYWKLLDTCLDSPVLGKQQIALLLLKRYSEYGNETAEFLNNSKRRDDPWTQQNIGTMSICSNILVTQL
jgi:hypothetical protein